jgi:hypothetical protein
MIEYPGLPARVRPGDGAASSTTSTIFRPKAALRVVWKAIMNRDVPRLYTEARSFMKLRGQRNRSAAATKAANALKAQESSS